VCVQAPVPRGLGAARAVSSWATAACPVIPSTRGRSNSRPSLCAARSAAASGPVVGRWPRSPPIRTGRAGDGVRAGCGGGAGTATGLPHFMVLDETPHRMCCIRALIRSNRSSPGAGL